MTCSHNGEKIYCEQCLIEINNLQSVVIDQLYQRLEAIYEAGSIEERKVVREVESRFPLTGIRVLDSIEFGTDFNKCLSNGMASRARAMLGESLRDFVLKYVPAKIKDPTLRVGFSDNSIFTYIAPPADHKAFMETFQKHGISFLKRVKTLQLIEGGLNGNEIPTNKD